MSKRLQVLIPPKEYKEFARIAAKSGMSLGEWVRQSLRKSARAVPVSDPLERWHKIQLYAAQHNESPAPDIKKMLSEIEKGRNIKKP